MSDIMRVLLFFAAIATGGWILYKIRRFQVKMQDAIFWVVFAAVLFILGVFPGACYWLTEKLGIISPANFVFLVVIFLLLEKVFTLSIIVSQLEEKISVLSAEIALRTSDSKKRLEKLEGENEELKEKEEIKEKEKIKEKKEQEEKNVQ